ncbi:MAG: dTDP-4-dehydrorhamnose reductase [Anaerolineales bacterium]|nr:dTDP-4-dehydrorhamnose reductase [Anaerolineales bacterium]
MNILLLGKNGQLGWELHRAMAPLGTVTALDYPEIDLLDLAKIKACVYSARPQLIINATAYTAVDRAESETDIAYAINAHAPGLLAELARDLRAGFIHYSTDYVFDGRKGSLYVETDLPHPINVYGSSKLAGEQAISQVDGAYLTLRTSWVYSLRRENFVTKVLSWARQQEILRIVDDQIGSPTWARMLAEITAQMLAQAASADIYDWLQARRGIYHLAGDGSASRLEWVRLILQLDPHRSTQLAREVLPASTGEFAAPAQRPLNSALNCDQFAQVFGLRLPPWREALALAMDHPA